MYIKEALEKHKKWLIDCQNGERANFNGINLMGVDLSGANFTKVIMCMVDLRAAILSKAILIRAFLKEANLSGADLRGANLSEADLRGANLRGANLEGADLRCADLSGADLSGANLGKTNLRWANLSEANLSGAENLLSAIDYLKEHFEFTSEGIIAYKTFCGTYTPPKKWVIQSGSVITENVNFNRTNECGNGINVAPLEWVYKNYGGKIWKVLIRWEWLAGVCVPYNTDGKIRCERVELVEIVDEESLSRALRKIIY